MAYLLKIGRALVLAKFYRLVRVVRLGVDLVVSGVELPLYVVDGGAAPKIVVLQCRAVAVAVAPAARRHKRIYDTFEHLVVLKYVSVPLACHIACRYMHVQSGCAVDLCAGLVESLATSRKAGEACTAVKDRADTLYAIVADDTAVTDKLVVLCIVAMVVALVSDSEGICVCTLVHKVAVYVVALNLNAERVAEAAASCLWRRYTAHCNLYV